MMAPATANMTYGTFAFDANGNPVPQANVKIWITFAIPTAPMPAGGYPTVIVQHGLSSSRAFELALANVLAAQGWLVAAIDSVTFGARATEPTNNADAKNNFGGPGSTYTGPDGFADVENGSTDFFGGLQNILAITRSAPRGGLRHGAGREAPSLDDARPLAAGTGSGTPKVDPSRIAYVGDSLGAMEGTLAAAIEPNVQAWFLNVNAGSLFPELAAHSPTIGPLLVEAAAFNFGLTGDMFSWSHPLVPVLQNIIEPGDPISYAAFLTTNPQSVAGVTPKPRNAVQTEVIWDDLVTDEANEAIARAAGWGVATPNVGSNAEITEPREHRLEPARDAVRERQPGRRGRLPRHARRGEHRDRLPGRPRAARIGPGRLDRGVRLPAPAHRPPLREAHAPGHVPGAVRGRPERHGHVPR